MRFHLFIAVLIAIICIMAPVSAARLPFYVNTDSSTMGESTETGYYGVTSVYHNSALIDEAIGGVWFYVQPNSILDYTLYFNDGTTKSGTVSFSQDSNLIGYTMELILNGVSDSLSGIHIPYSKATVQLGYYVVNETDFQLGITNKNLDIFIVDPQVYIDIDNPTSNPIYQIDITSYGVPFDVKIESATLEAIASAKIQHESGANNFIGFVVDTATGIYSIIMLLWGIFSYFFIENLLLTVILIEGGILAYRTCTAPNIFVALSLIIQDNERLITGLILFLQKLIELIWDVANFLNPLRWILGK